MRVTIEFNSGWIFEASGVNSFAVNKVRKEIIELLGDSVSVESSSTTSLILEIDTSDFGQNARAQVEKFIQDALAEAKVAPGVYSVSIQGESESQATQDSVVANLERYLAKDAAVTKGADESPEKAAVEPSGAHDDSAKAPQIPAIQQIDQLVGAAAFKEFCHNVEKQADFVRRNKTQKVFLSTAFLFSIPFGCGFSRATKLLAALLQENGILEEGYGFKDVELPSPVDADASSRMANLVGSLEHSFASANVITVDVASWADSASSDDFKKLLLNIHRNSGKALVILKTLPLSAGSFDLLKTEIQDVLPVCPVVFEPFDAMETHQVAAGRLAILRKWRFWPRATQVLIAVCPML